MSEIGAYIDAVYSECEAGKETLNGIISNCVDLYAFEYKDNEKEAAATEAVKDQIRCRFINNGDAIGLELDTESSEWLSVMESGNLPYTVGYGNQAKNPDGSTYTSKNRAPAGRAIPELASAPAQLTEQIKMMTTDLGRDIIKDAYVANKAILAQCLKPEIVSALQNSIGGK